MEHIFMKQSKQIISEPMNNKNFLQRVKDNKPDFEFITINNDYEVNEFPKIILCNPKKNNINLKIIPPLKRDENKKYFLIIKDISNSKKYFTRVYSEDLIDDSNEYILQDGLESLSLVYSEEHNKFLIY